MVTFSLTCVRQLTLSLLSCCVLPGAELKLISACLHAYLTVLILHVIFSHRVGSTASTDFW